LIRYVLYLLVVSSITYAGDGLFWAAATNSAGVYFYRSEISTPGAAANVGKPLKYLKFVDGTVLEMSSEEKAAIDLAESQSAAVAASNAAVQAAIAASNAAVQAAIAATNEAVRLATITAYRNAYRDATYSMCDLFGITRTPVLMATEILQRGEALTNQVSQFAAIKLSLQLTNIEQKLCRLDGPDALDRVVP
jgi:hypothetical protein